MDCILVEVKDRIEVLVTTTWKLVLALLGGILTGVMCTIVVYFIKKWFYKTVSFIKQLIATSQSGYVSNEFRTSAAVHVVASVVPVLQSVQEIHTAKCPPSHWSRL